MTQSFTKYASLEIGQTSVLVLSDTLSSVGYGQSGSFISDTEITNVIYEYFNGNNIPLISNKDLHFVYSNDPLIKKYDFIFIHKFLCNRINFSEHLLKTFNCLNVGGKLIIIEPCNDLVSDVKVQFSPTFFRDLEYANNTACLVARLSLRSGNRIINYLQGWHDLIGKAFISSNHGVFCYCELEKLRDESLHLNFIQEKYRLWYERTKGDNKDVKKYFNFSLKKLVITFLHSPKFPWWTKKIVLNVIKRKLKNRTVN